MNMNVLGIINLCLGVIFTLCYWYQFVYLIVAYFGGIKKYPESTPKKLAILIAARNEECVIRDLINSMISQDYPKESYDVFLVADNCTDNTAAVAREAGAIVYERHNKTEIGKGYALDYLIKKIEADFGDAFYDAYIVFDADNTAEPNYLSEMNKAYSAGYDVVTSYRNASNYGKHWRAGGQGMYFLRDARVLNLARTRFGANTFVTGTGFLFSSELCRRYGGWPFHMLTEDGEFTMHNTVNSVKTAYCNDAIFYDEQAVDVRTSWNQQLRWCRGGLQIFSKYLPKLFRGLFSKRFLASFDMMMCLTPAYILSLVAVIANVITSIVLLCTGTDFLEIFFSIIPVILMAYSMLLVFSIFITISDWKRIRASAPKKILYAFTFPLFLFTFVPAAFVAIFKKVEWKPIHHEGSAIDAGSAAGAPATAEAKATSESDATEDAEGKAEVSREFATK